MHLHLSDELRPEMLDESQPPPRTHRRNIFQAVMDELVSYGGLLTTRGAAYLHAQHTASHLGMKQAARCAEMAAMSLKPISDLHKIKPEFRHMVMSFEELKAA